MQTFSHTINQVRQAPLALEDKAKFEAHKLVDWGTYLVPHQPDRQPNTSGYLQYRRQKASVRRTQGIITFQTLLLKHYPSSS